MRPDVQLLLQHALAVFLLLGAWMGVALGLVLIYRARWLTPLSHIANRWVSARFVSVWLDRNISIEHWFYKHHRAVGISVVCGAAYVFCYFALLFNKAVVLSQLKGALSAPQIEGLLDAMVLAALTGSAVAMWVGLYLWLRPSWLRGIERRSNAWVSTRRATRTMDVQHDQIDTYVLRHAQGAGWLLLLASLGLLLLLLRWWL